MKYNFSAFDYKDMWEGLYKEFGNYWSTFDVRDGNPKYKYLSDLMDNYKEDYGKNRIDKPGYRDVEEFYND